MPTASLCHVIAQTISWSGWRFFIDFAIGYASHVTLDETRDILHEAGKRAYNSNYIQLLVFPHIVRKICDEPTGRLSAGTLLSKRSWASAGSASAQSNRGQ